MSDTRLATENYYQFIIPRLNGKDIEKDFDYYLGLVRKGIAGFIIFGGKLETVRQGISELQRAAKGRLIIASDLERGLGQQLIGGTIFPPAMAIAAAFRSCQPSAISYQQKILLRKIFKAVAIEARYAGINTIFAPVLDINTNPKNPIIATRSFGEDTETVSFFGCEMIKAFQSSGIVACGKHFPGHGDTEIDSHISLPVIKKDLRSLGRIELVPFKNAIKAGVKMIMLGHLRVPALDPSGIPVSLSGKAVSYLRNRLGFNGIIITDALNMGGINWGNSSKSSTIEERASLMALRAGVDILLHPTNPDKIAAYLEKKLSALSNQLSVNTFRKSLRLPTGKIKVPAAPDFGKNRELSEKITKMSIRIDGQIGPLKKPFLIILNDEENAPSPSPPFKKGGEGGFDKREEWKRLVLAKSLKKKFPDLKFKIAKKDSEFREITFPENAFVIVAIFSKIRAWKGGPSSWLLRAMKRLEERVDVFISFGSPYLLDAIEKKPDTTPFNSPLTKGDLGGCRIGTVPAVKIYAYWDSESAQKAVAELL